MNELAMRHTTNNNKRSLVNKWKSVHSATLLYAVTASHMVLMLKLFPNNLTCLLLAFYLNSSKRFFMEKQFVNNS